MVKHILSREKKSHNFKQYHSCVYLSEYLFKTHACMLTFCLSPFLCPLSPLLSISVLCSSSNWDQLGNFRRLKWELWHGASAELAGSERGKKRRCKKKGEVEEEGREKSWYSRSIGPGRGRRDNSKLVLSDELMVMAWLMQPQQLKVTSFFMPGIDSWQSLVNFGGTECSMAPTSPR